MVVYARIPQKRKLVPGHSICVTGHIRTSGVKPGKNQNLWLMATFCVIFFADQEVLINNCP